jgi:hypothetical protein
LTGEELLKALNEISDVIGVGHANRPNISSETVQIINTGRKSAVITEGEHRPPLTGEEILQSINEMSDVLGKWPPWFHGSIRGLIQC